MSVQVDIIQKSCVGGTYALKPEAPYIPGFIAVEPLPATHARTTYIAVSDIARMSIDNENIGYLVDEIPLQKIKVKCE